MAQHVRNQVNIPGFVIQICCIRAPELMGADLRFQRRRNRRVFFNQVLNGPLGDPFPLQAQEQRVLMSGQGFGLLSFFHIFRQGVRHFRGKVEHHLIAAFAGDDKGVVFKIDVVQVHSDAFADPDSGSEEQGKQRKIAFCRQLLEFQLPFGQLFAGLRGIQDPSQLLPGQADDRLFMDLGEGNELRYIGRDPLVFKQIIVKRTDAAQLPLDRQFVVDICFVRYRIIIGLEIIGEIFRIGGEIVPGQLLQILVRPQGRFPV